ncbi:MAG: glycosyltransferase [Patescibacteria group bacterium]|jgi:glycosyltransferase involved in cell wall biosynthesis
MKILFASNLFGRNARGGAESVVRAEAEALLRAGHEVTVVHGIYGAEKPEREFSGLRTIAYRPPQIFDYTELGRHGQIARLAWHWLDIFNSRSAARFADIVRREKPDVVHTHNLMGLGFLIPAQLRLLRVKHVHMVHDVQLLHPSGLLAAARDPLGGGWAQKIYIRLLRRLFGSPAAVIFPSLFLKDLHVQAGFFPSSRLELFRNPAPAAVASVPPRSGKPVFLFAGQVEEHKGILRLIEVWRRSVLRDRAILEIAGSGAFTAAAAGMAAGDPSIRFLGRLDRPALEQALDRASFVVLPSLVIENAPTVILEALSRGVPAVAAATGGVPEIIVDGRTGFLFRAGDDADLERSLVRAAAEPADGWAELSARCRERAGELTMEKHLAALLATYRG